MIWVSLPSVHWSPICISKIYKELTQLNNKQQPKQKMGRTPKYTFLQRHTDGRKAQEKMLNIANYQGNASQTDNEIHLLQTPSLHQVLFTYFVVLCSLLCNFTYFLLFLWRQQCFCILGESCTPSNSNMSFWKRTDPHNGFLLPSWNSLIFFF